MANADRPRGLVPFGEVIRSRPYTAGSACYKGDPVKGAADGSVDPSVTPPLLGVALSYAASGDKVMVADHPEQLFVCQVDDATIDAADHRFQVANLVLGTPDTTYNISRAEVDGDTADTTAATAAVKILDLAPDSANAYGANADVVVRIQNHQLSGAGAVGV